MATRERAPLPANFVGRERELHAVLECFDSAAASGGRLAVISGDAGVGKTRLAEVASSHMSADGAVVVWGTAWEGGAPEYWPWVQVIRAYLRQSSDSERLGRDSPQLRQLLPELPTDEGLAREATPDDRFALFEAMRRFIELASAEAPLVVVLDDCHAADPSSLLLLRFLTASLRGLPVLVLLTTRPIEAVARREAASTLATISRQGTTIRLGGFGLEEVRDYVRVASQLEPADQLVEKVHDATEGNAFLVREVVRLLDASGETELARLPAELRGIVRRRLGMLSSETRELLVTAAVAGREFESTVVELAAEAPAETVRASLAEAAAAHIVVAQDTLGRFAFAHALTRETLYQDISIRERMRLHMRVARALEKAHGSADDSVLPQLAFHFAQAAVLGDPVEAADYCQRAGDRALRFFAFEEAAAHYECGLQVLELAPHPDARRLALLLKAGKARSYSAESDPARRLFAEAFELARGNGDGESMAHAVLGFGGGLGGFEFGSTSRALIAMLDEAAAVLDEGSAALLARVLGRHAVELYFTDEGLRRKALATRSVQLARQSGDSRALAASLAARHLALWSPDTLDDRLTDAEEIVALGRQTANRELAARGRVWLFADRMEAGDVYRANLELDELASLAEDLKQPLYQWYTRLFRSMQALLEGRFDDSERAAAEALEVARRAQTPNGSLLYAAQVFALRWEQGRLDEVASTLDEPADRFPAMPAWTATRALIQCELGRRSEASASLERLAAGGLASIRRDGEWLGTMASLAQLCYRLGDAERARAVLDLLIPFRRRIVVMGRGAASMQTVAFHLGCLAAAVGDMDSADEYFLQAINVGVRLGARPWVARAQREYATVLLKSASPNRADQAAALMDSSEALARRMGTRSFAERRAGELRPHERVARAQPVERAILRREGEYWSVGRGEPFRLRHSNGLWLLAELLRHPGREMHAVELATSMGRPPPRRRDIGAAGIEATAGGPDDAGDILDDRARRAYQRRLKELETELAKRHTGPARDMAEAEVAHLRRELSAGVGLAGRPRRAASNSERARVSVTKALRTAIARISEHDAELGEHLNASVRTGIRCAYVPRPTANPSWEISD